MQLFFICKEGTNWRVLTQDKIPLMVTDDVLDAELSFYRRMLNIDNLDAIPVREYMETFEVLPKRILNEVKAQDE